MCVCVCVCMSVYIYIYIYIYIYVYVYIFFIIICLKYTSSQIGLMQSSHKLLFCMLLLNRVMKNN